MTSVKPPTLALALLSRIARDNEPLAGDLLEEFQARRSKFWLWRQLVMTIVIRAVCGPHPPVSLNLVPVDPVVAEWLMDRRLEALRPRKVNLTGTAIEGIGGLTMVILGFLISMVVPAIWWFVMGGIVAGIALGVFMVSQHGGTEPRRITGIYRS